MANRYWIGNSGSGNDTAHWSSVSGGSGGASVPTSVDDVFIDVNSVTLTGQTINLQPMINCRSLSTDGVLNLPTLALNINVYGNLLLKGVVLSTGLVLKGSSAQAENYTIKTNGISLPSFNITASFAATKYTLLDNLSIVGNDIVITTGTLDTGGYGINMPNYSIRIANNSSKFICNNSTMSLSSLSFYGGATASTFECGTSTIHFKYFSQSLSLTFYDVVILDGYQYGVYSNGTCTFNTLTVFHRYEIGGNYIINTLNNGGFSLSFAANTVIRVNNLASGLGLYPKVQGDSYSFIKTSGVLELRNGYIKGCIASGGATFRAINCTDGGSNSGWTWRGSASSGWEQLSAAPSSAEISALVEWRGNLYCATNNNGGKLFKYEGSALLTQVAPSYNGILNITNLIVWNDKIYATTGNASGNADGGRLLEFDNINNVWISRAATYNNTEYWVYSPTIFNGELYVGSYPNAYLLKWTGTAWTKVIDRYSTETYLISLVVYNNKLYAAAYNTRTLLEMNNGAWTPVGTAPAGVTYILFLWDNKLCVLCSATGIVYYWNGSNALISFITYPAAGLYKPVIHEGNLYFGDSTGKLLLYNGTTTLEVVANAYNGQANIMCPYVFDYSIHSGTASGGRLFRYYGHTTRIAPTMIANNARMPTPVISYAYAPIVKTVPTMIANNARIPTPNIVVSAIDVGIKVQVYDITNDSYFDLTYQENEGKVNIEALDYCIFEPVDNWINNTYSFSFDADSHPTCDALVIKFTNLHTGAVYIKDVMLAPDYTGKWPQIYKLGPKSESKESIGITVDSVANLSPVVNDLWYNTQTSEVKHYDGANWISNLTVYKCTLIANGYIASNSVILSVGLNSYPITRNGDEITLGTNYTEFNDNNRLNFYLNGTLLEKAVDCIYVSNLSFYLVTALDSTDVITIIKGGN